MEETTTDATHSTAIGGDDQPPWPWEENYADGVDWRAPIPAKPLYAILDDAVAQFSDRPCADFLGKSFTYREIGDLVNRAAKGLQAIGVGPGTHVGLFLPNTPYYIVCYFAVLKSGGTVVNFNPLYAEREIAHQIEDSETDIMVTLDLAVLHGKLARMLTDTRLNRLVMCRMTGILPPLKSVLYRLFKKKEQADVPQDDRHLWFDDLVANNGHFTPAAVDTDAVAVLQYTGGTTGVPKGAMLTHANLYANAIQSRMWFKDARPGQEVTVAVLPFFHVFAMTVVLNLSLILGVRIILMPRFELAALLKQIAKDKPTLFSAVPTIYNALANHPSLSKYDMTSFRMCISGGAPLPLEVKQKFETLTGCTLVEGYGLSESSPVLSANPLTGLNKAGSIGLPFPGTVMRIMDVDDRTAEMPMGERGEVCASGPQVMKGYWNNEQETAQVMIDGLLHTGDVGYMDEDGYVFIVDRIKDVILCSGYNVYPRNVEEAIYLHPAVEECVVAGLPDSYRGQTVKAYIKVVEGRELTADDLRAFLKDKLSSIEIPKHIEFRDTLPKTMIGKLSRKALLEEEEARKGEAPS